MSDWQDLQEIHRLLDEAYRHYFAHGDGHCKSSEGYISVDFGNYWDRVDRVEKGLAPLAIHSVEVYSYVLGPHRSHYFDSVAEALATVRKWHHAEMTHDYSDDEWADADFKPI